MLIYQELLNTYRTKQREFRVPVSRFAKHLLGSPEPSRVDPRLGLGRLRQTWFWRVAHRPRRGRARLTLITPTHLAEVERNPNPGSRWVLTGCVCSGWKAAWG